MEIENTNRRIIDVLRRKGRMKKMDKEEED